MIHIDITHSLIVWIACSALFVFSIFWTIRHFKNTFYPLGIRTLLAVLRWIALLFLILIATDMKITRTRQLQRAPAIAFIWDLSGSIAATSPFTVTDVLQSGSYRFLRRETKVEHIVNMEKPEIITESALRRKMIDGAFTDCGKLLRFAEEQSTYRQCVLISDGQSYLGESLGRIRLSDNLKIYTIGVGEPVSKGVPSLQSVHYPEYITQIDSAEVSWVIYNISDKELQGDILIKDGEKILYKYPVEIAAQRMQEFDHLFLPLREGGHTWTWNFSDGITSTHFGSQTVYVHPSRVRVVCDADPPDEDIAMVSTVLSQSDRYVLFKRDEWEQNYPGEKPDLLIQTWHSEHQPQYFSNVPAVLFYRQPGDLYRSVSAFQITTYRPYVMITPDPNRSNQLWKQVPPLFILPYSGSGTTVLSIGSGQPVIVEDAENQRILILAAGLWRWQLAGYQKPWDGLYRHLIEEMVWESLKQYQQGFIALDKKQYVGTQYIPLYFTVNIKNWDLLDAASAQVSISVYDTAFSEIRREDSGLKPRITSSLTLSDTGTYFITARIFASGKHIESDTAYLRITASDFEMNALGCDAAVLKQLSNNHHGSYVHLDNIDSLRNIISTEKQWITESQIFLARHSILFFVLMFLAICADWILRKRYGGS
ncbi:MAG: hypothetical protein KAT14_08200 [Candidatus Marinimicrobia bacterium]|nr:hypothetical protein [Candidatus Neomarinimicrobiota bacterium]